ARAVSRQDAIRPGRKRSQRERTVSAGDRGAVDRVGHSQPAQDLAGLLVPLSLGVDEDSGDRLARHVQHAALERDARLERELAKVASLSLRNAVQLARKVV